MINKEVFSQNLRVLMALKPTKSKELSAAIGLSQTSIAGYAKGRIHPSMKAVQALAGYFGVTPQQFITEYLFNANESVVSSADSVVQLSTSK